MKPKSVTYAKLKNLGNYENERIEITLEVEDGEKAADVLEIAKVFVLKQFGEFPTNDDFENAEQLLKLKELDNKYSI